MVIEDILYLALVKLVGASDTTELEGMKEIMKHTTFADEEDKVATIGAIDALLTYNSIYE